MGILPEKIGLFSKQTGLKQGTGQRFERVRFASDDTTRPEESDWDEIICANVELVADALREARVIAEDSTLGLIGGQIEYVDVVFAELRDIDGLKPDAPDTWKEPPRRLVLLEDKLIRNHQAKREVLAQILDYADKAEFGWSTDTFMAASASAKKRSAATEKKAGIGDLALAAAEPWLEKSRVQIDALLRHRDLLLVIAGDAIDDRLLRLARQFARHDNPLSLHELCLLSMALYERGDEYLLVPHVVSAVQRPERELALRVTVLTQDGAPVDASVARDTEAEQLSAGRRARENPDVSAFLQRVKTALEPQLPKGFPEPTKKPKKNLEYVVSDEQFGSARFKIHFGLWNPRSFSTIGVGLLLETPDRDTRDEWRLPLEKAASGIDFQVDAEAGPRSVFVHKDIGWTEGEPLDDKLLAQVCSSFLRLLETVGPLFVPASS